MHQKGLIPIIYLIIGATIIASAVFGITKYGDEIAANASKIIKPKIVVYNIVSTTEGPSLLEDLPDELSAEETNSPAKKADETENKKQVEATEESTNIIEKLKKEIEALKKQPPSVIYKEIINTYKGIYFDDNNQLKVEILIEKEIDSFLKTVNKGIKLLQTAKNINGKLMLLVYGLPVSVNVDPIEKKPLYHFLPGTKSFSFGTVGCNFKCGWCQNFDLSQMKKIVGEEVSPEQIVE